jgi:hypothetical protein
MCPSIFIRIILMPACVSVVCLVETWIRGAGSIGVIFDPADIIGGSAKMFMMSLSESC